MLNFIRSISTTIVSLVLFVAHTIQSFLKFILNIPTYVLYLTNTIANMPTIYIPFLTVSVSIYVMYLLTNRSLNE